MRTGGIIEGLAAPETVMRYDIGTDKMRPVTQDEFDNLENELQRLYHFQGIVMNMSRMSLDELRRVRTFLAAELKRG